MTSTIKVDTIQTAAGAVPTIGDLSINNSGTVVQVQRASDNTPTTLTTGGGNVTVVSLNFTPLYTDSIIRFHWSHGQVQKVTGAGVNTWISFGVNVGGTDYQNLGCGAMGYPETFANHRYVVSHTGYLDSWSGQKTITHWANVGSTGSSWNINYQNYTALLEVTEIAQ